MMNLHKAAAYCEMLIELAQLIQADLRTQVAGIDTLRDAEEQRVTAIIRHGIIQHFTPEYIARQVLAEPPSNARTGAEGYFDEQMVDPEYRAAYEAAKKDQ